MDFENFIFSICKIVSFSTFLSEIQGEHTMEEFVCMIEQMVANTEIMNVYMYGDNNMRERRIY